MLTGMLTADPSAHSPTFTAANVFWPGGTETSRTLIVANPNTSFRQEVVRNSLAPVSRRFRRRVRRRPVEPVAILDDLRQRPERVDDERETGVQHEVLQERRQGGEGDADAERGAEVALQLVRSSLRDQAGDRA